MADKPRPPHTAYKPPPPKGLAPRPSPEPKERPSSVVESTKTAEPAPPPARLSPDDDLYDAATHVEDAPSSTGLELGDSDISEVSRPAMPRVEPDRGEDPLIGRLINERFRIRSAIARGGMGKVYRAEQEPLGREVALKVLHPSYQGDNDPEFHKRFYLEASTQSKLTHPNTVTIFDYGRTEDDIYYIAMELLEGRTLHRALKDEGAMPPDKALHIARQICRSLREAHSLGVIHRDLKPANVFLVRHGEQSDFAKVLDFGLVKDLGDKGEDLTQTGLFMGSPKYMSPEQIRGDAVDHRCDVYSLGVMLYEMLAGAVPFDRANSVNILMAHVHDDVPQVSASGATNITPALDALVQRAMAKSPAERFSGMDEFLVAIKEASEGDGSARSSFGATALSGELSLSSASFPRDASRSGSGEVDLSSSSASHSFAEARSRAAELATSRPAPPKKRAPWIVAVLAVAALCVAAFVFWNRPDHNAPVVATPLAPVPVPSARVSPSSQGDSSPTPAPGERVVRVHLESDPPGATVTVDGETHPTPIDLEWRGEDAVQGRHVTFHFQLEGYRDYTANRTVLGDSIDLTGRLSRRDAIDARRRRRPAGGAAMPGRRPTESTVSPMGYKVVPY